MNSRRKIAWMIVAGVSLAGIVFWLLRPREPEYQGRPLSAWLEQLTATRDGVEHEQAVEAVRAMGTNAIPQLIYLGTYRDAHWRVLLDDTLDKHGQHLRFKRAFDRSQKARAGFVALGSEGKKAVTELERLLKHGDSAPAASSLLVAIGPSSIPVLVSALSHSNQTTRVSALRGLGNLGAAAEEAIPNIIAVIDTNDPLTSAFAYQSLGQIGKAPEKAIPVLVNGLGDPHVMPRSYAARALAKFGPEAEIARAALEAAVKEPNIRVRSAAQSALDHLNTAR